MGRVAFVLVMLFSLTASAFEWEVMSANGNTQELVTYRTDDFLSINIGNITCAFKPGNVSSDGNNKSQIAQFACTNGNMFVTLLLYCSTAMAWTDGFFVSIVGDRLNNYEIHGRCLRP